MAKRPSHPVPKMIAIVAEDRAGCDAAKILIDRLSVLDPVIGAGDVIWYREWVTPANAHSQVDYFSTN